jgi:DNA-binding NarL/FixJ family response regulator
MNLYKFEPTQPVKDIGMTTNIILADDHQVMREGLKSLLNQQKDMEVIGEADDGQAAVRLTKKLEPDIVVLDIGMPNMNGIQATQHIVAEVPNTKVLALSMHSDHQFVVKMLQAGASGYLLKDCALEELVSAVRDITNGKFYLSKDVTGVVISDYINKIKAIDSIGQPILTPRERETLQLIAEGKSTADTAKLLNVSTKTIETHRKNIMDKLDIHSIAELTKYAVREGLTSIED